MKYCQIIFVFIIFSAMFSCDDQTASNNNEFNERPTNQAYWLNYNWSSSSGIDPSNINNPYDLDGQEHNNALDYFIAHYDTTLYENQNAADTVLSIVADFAIIKGSQLTKDSIISLIESKFSASNQASFEIMISTQSASQNIADMKLDFYQYLFSTNYDYEEIIDSCKERELNVSNNGNLTSEEKEDYLSFMSIIRYSLVYWNDVDSGLRLDWPYETRKKYSDPNVDFQGTKTKATADASWRKTHPNSPSWEISAASTIASALKSVTDAIGDTLIELGEWIKSWFE